MWLQSNELTYSESLLSLVMGNELNIWLLKNMFELVCKYMGDDLGQMVFFQKEGGMLSIYSSISDADQINYVKKYLENASENYKSSMPFYSKPKESYGKIIPILVSGKAVGYWISEYNYRHLLKRVYRKHFMKLAAFVLGMFYLKREETKSRYIDPGTGIPGNAYFLELIEFLCKQNAPSSICYIQLQKKNLTDMEQEMAVILQKIRELKAGFACRIKEDTFAVAFSCNLIEAYDMVCLLPYHCQMELVTIKGLLCKTQEVKSIYSGMGQYFLKCQALEILVLNNLPKAQALFGIKETEPKAEARPENQELLGLIREDLSLWQ